MRTIQRALPRVLGTVRQTECCGARRLRVSAMWAQAASIAWVSLACFAANGQTPSRPTVAQSDSVAAHVNDFPTRARVEFVLECMRSSKASAEEAMYKCSCAIDEIAGKVDYATWVELSTVANATTIAGERGGVLRDMKDGRKLTASFRELQADAKKRCFIEH